ncbi:hypothetical protein SISSUDRAFT_1034929 [Sistotremastrum suecicum HHB10207 ss-3]|uniref:Uncharacterized protein n=1 Tax=Sistotremastrum suecicum HHB10207 ss-3 TaxID=1314776 RepID=A0A166BGJ5_9AGAM|nr:hypothetical protein SISSUDRAFT_1034929 [Sistotremastrum suecicum HHB10207 ss-3]
MRRTPLTSAGSTRPGRPFDFPSIDLVLELRHLPPQIQMSWRQHPVFFPAPVYQENLYQENPALEQAANLNGVHQQLVRLPKIREEIRVYGGVQSKQDAPILGPACY